MILLSNVLYSYTQIIFDGLMFCYQGDYKGKGTDLRQSTGKIERCIFYL